MGQTIIHATAIAVSGHGLIIRGPSGSGKSDLALRLIDGGAILIADDRLVCHALGNRLMLSAPAPIAGLIEVRGIGLLPMPHVAAAAALVLDCGRVPERQPLPDHCLIDGIRLPRLDFDSHAVSAAAKARLALALAAAGRLWQENGDA